MKLKIGNKLFQYLEADIHNAFAYQLLTMYSIPENAKLNYIEVEVNEGRLKFSYLQDSRKSDDPFETTLRQVAKPITVLKKLLPSADLNTLNSWIDKLKQHFALPEHTIDVVRGDDILQIYLEDNYLTLGSSTLGQSCMRYRKCQPFLQFYAKNKNVAGVCVSVSGKVAARALLWTATHEKKKVTVLDRIYGKSDVFAGVIDKWSDDNSDFTLNHLTKAFRNNKDRTLSYMDMYVALNHTEGPYPYVDNFYLLMGSRLYNIWNPKQTYKNITSTSGDAAASNALENYVPGTVWVEAKGWIPRQDAVVYKNLFITKDSVQSCSLCTMYLPKSKVVPWKLDSKTYTICDGHTAPYMIDGKPYNACKMHLLLHNPDDMCSECAKLPRYCYTCGRTSHSYIINNAQIICAICQENQACSQCESALPRYQLTQHNHRLWCDTCMETWDRCEDCELRIQPDTECPCQAYYTNCPECDCRVHTDHTWYIRGAEGGYCSQCYTEVAVICSSCEEGFLNEDMSPIEGVCTICYEEYAYECRLCHTQTVTETSYVNVCYACVSSLEFRCISCRTWTVFVGASQHECINCTPPVLQENNV